MKAITQLAQTFTFQSYYGALLRNAILAQTNGNPIVDSTKQYAQTGGIGVALHPSSQSPVAIKFAGGDVDSAVIHLVPGQKVMTGPFKRFEWGLPFGWLGGGPVILYVIHEEKIDFTFPSVNSPIIFHRQRTLVVAAAPAAPSIPNWPLAFPWSNEVRGIVAGVGPTPQPAAPLISIIPEQAVLQLRGALAAPITVGLQFTNTDAFDLNSPPDQAAGYSNGQVVWEVTIPTTAAGGAAPVWLPPEVAALGGDFAAVDIVDLSNTITGAAVDIARYGRFM